MARKSVQTASESAENDDLQEIRDSFYHLNDTDHIVNVLTRSDPGPGGFIQSELVGSVEYRRTYFHDRSLSPPDDDLARLVTLLNNDRLKDKQEDFPAKFIFTD